MGPHANQARVAAERECMSSITADGSGVVARLTIGVLSWDVAVAQKG